jgi:hypothetical protein
MKGTKKPTRAAEQLDWKQIDSLTRTVAVDLIDEKRQAAGVLMVLMKEISGHPFDCSYVESIANLLLHHLFAFTKESEVAFEAFVTREREMLIGKGGE